VDRAGQWLADALGYRFSDAGLLRLALTHRSANGPSNERLEFLGDAVLDFVISEVVYEALPDAPEGDLSRLRSSLVRDDTLAALANGLGLGAHLELGSGEKKSGGHRRDSILADALEAIFGAAYLDGGIDAAAALIRAAYGDWLSDFPDAADLRDPKTRLQEWLQARARGLPEYELVSVSGEPHRQSFEVRCIVDGGAGDTSGSGRSRRAAEQQAARRMLELLTAGSGP